MIVREESVAASAGSLNRRVQRMFGYAYVIPTRGLLRPIRLRLRSSTFGGCHSHCVTYATIGHFWLWKFGRDKQAPADDFWGCDYIFHGRATTYFRPSFCCQVHFPQMIDLAAPES